MSSRSAKNRLGVKKKQKLGGGLSALTVVLVILVGVVGGAFAALTVWLSDLPDYEKANAFNTAMPTYVYADDGETVLARFQLEYREPVEMDQISPIAVDATLAIEDARFYEHSGIDFYGVMRALVNNLAGGSLEGASTITQQFVRNTILAEEMDDITIKRKVREAYVSLQLEKMYSKDEILNMYLNTINYGAGAHGIEAAARRYFSKHANELTLTEAALLAGIPQSPTYNDPLQYPDQALQRRNSVLKRMLAENFITDQEYNVAIQQPLGLKPQEIVDDSIKEYPYFVSYVRDVLYNDLKLSETEVLKGGLKVYTTLNIERQEAAEEACRIKRQSMYGDSMEVAMAVVEPDTGFVQAMVGGSDWEKSQVNLATGQGGYGRPCGSVFKTFTLATAIKMGIDPKTTYVDCTSPATIDGYTLENYDNGSYGTRTVANAFAISSNTGFVRLISSVGVKETALTAYDLGITSDLHEDQAAATLTLGVQNVTPLELANAAATIANGGVRHDVCAIAYIENRDDQVIVDNRDPEKRAKRVLSKQEAFAIQEVMQGVIQFGTGTAAALGNGQQVAGKTGTSEDYKDISFIGFTPYFAAAIWIGDPTNKASVPTGTCADVFRTFATTVIQEENLPVKNFPRQSEPRYTKFDNQRYHVSYKYAQYGVDDDEEKKKKEEEEKKKKEEEEKKKQEEEDKKNQGTTTDPKDPTNPTTPSDPSTTPSDPTNPGTTPGTGGTSPSTPPPAPDPASSSFASS